VGLDLVFVPGFVSHVEHSWEEPGLARFFERLGSFSRLIRLDKRGTGLSDRVSAIPTLEQRTDDLSAVMDAVDCARAALLGISEGGPVAMLFAAMYPERTRALVLYSSYARRAWAPDYRFGHTDADFKALLATIEAEWGVRPASGRALRARATTTTSGSGGRRACASPQAPALPWRCCG
jgi:pimeloyl-ACP methyl ester carboxylesterase